MRMMMNEIGLLLPAFVTGILLGAVFFGGLWWTIQKGLVSANPALWFISSLLIRTAFTVTGFYLISAGSWQKLLTCLSGFLITRLILTRFSRLSNLPPIPTSEETHHAP